MSPPRSAGAPSLDSSPAIDMGTLVTMPSRAAVGPTKLLLICFLPHRPQPAPSRRAVVSCNRCRAQPPARPGRFLGGATLTARERMTTSDDTFRLLYEVAVATSGVLEPERLGRLAVQRACELTGADSALLFWWVPERELLIFLAGHPEGARPGLRTRARGEGLVGIAFDTGSPQVVQDYPRWPAA